jgi:Fe2+ or Zn2+ uptake regulation protein
MAHFLVTQCGNELEWHEANSPEEVQEIVAQGMGYESYEHFLEIMEEMGEDLDFNVIEM